MDLERRHNSTVPFISRLDRLDFIMKRLESKHPSTKWASRSSEVMPLDLAVRESYFKGSLTDRINSLEHRLLQLLLEIDSSTPTSTLTPSQETSSSQESKRELPGSSATFSFPSCQLIPELRPIPPTNTEPEIQEQPTTKQIEQKTKKPTAAPAKAQTRKNRAVGEADKSCKTLNKRPPKPRSSVYVRLLGC